MFVVQSYAVAVAFCVVTMLCWGSWANTQKLAGQTLAVRVVLLGLRLRRVADGPDLRFHAGQHGGRRPRISGRPAAGRPGRTSARPFWAAWSSTRPISCWWRRSPSPACRWRFPWASAWPWCWACWSTISSAPKGEPVLLFLGRGIHRGGDPAGRAGLPQAPRPVQGRRRQGAGAGRALRHVDGLSSTASSPGPCPTPSPRTFCHMPAGKLSPIRRWSCSPWACWPAISSSTR